MTGRITLVIAGVRHVLEAGGFAYVPPGMDWTVRNDGAEPARFHWIRKRHRRVEALPCRIRS